MFTGIVQELGRVVAVDAGEDDARLVIESGATAAGATLGDSVAVDGVCLTVAERGEGRFTADVMRETLVRTGLGALTAGDRVNLERPVPANGLLDGHVVQGHVDGTATVLERIPGSRWEVVRISLPASLARYVVEKGSIAVDGVSLTVASVDDGPDGRGESGSDGSSFTVSLIPTTMEATSLGTKAVGATVNLEVDVLAKYVERMLAARGGAA